MKKIKVSLIVIPALAGAICFSIYTGNLIQDQYVVMASSKQTSAKLNLDKKTYSPDKDGKIQITGTTNAKAKIVADSKNKTTANKKGKFTLKLKVAKDAKQVTIKAEKSGYETSQKTVTIKQVPQKPSKTDTANAGLAKNLAMAKGWAQGTLDNNGDPISNGTPNPDYSWSLLVDKMVAHKDGEVFVYVTGEFVNSTDADKDTVAHRAQQLAAPDLLDSKLISTDESTEGAVMSFRLGKNAVGQSKVLNHKEFTWY